MLCVAWTLEQPEFWLEASSGEAVRRLAHAAELLRKLKLTDAMRDKLDDALAKHDVPELEGGRATDGTNPVAHACRAELG